jgi:hypothetical protein
MMKMRYFLILVIVFFGFALWMGRLTPGMGRWPERLDISYAVSLTALAMGGLIAAMSLFALLQRGLSGQTLEQSLPLVLALLGGLLLYQVNWGVALALGMIGAAAIVTRRWGGSKGP